MFGADYPNPASLVGGGEMGALMRAKNWATSPLGCLETWPQGVKTALSISLNSRLPVELWLRSDLRLVYNDAYIPLLGERRHPSALGEAGREIWKESWPSIGPTLGVSKAGRCTSVEDFRISIARRFPIEQSYFSLTCSPIASSDGYTNNGVFGACIETTEKVVRQRGRTTSGDPRTQAAERRIASLDAADEASPMLPSGEDSDISEAQTDNPYFPESDVPGVKSRVLVVENNGDMPDQLCPLLS